MDEDDFFLIGRRHIRSNNSWLHNSERLMKGRERCTLMMNSEDAKKRNLQHGDMVKVVSKTGEVEVLLEVTENILKGVVSLPHGFGHGREGVQLNVAKSIMV